MLGISYAGQVAALVRVFFEKGGQLEAGPGKGVVSEFPRKEEKK